MREKREFALVVVVVVVVNRRKRREEAAKFRSVDVGGCCNEVRY